MTPEAAKELKMDDVKGVVVSSVKQGSLADEAGLREGMVIERINKHAVTTPEEFRERNEEGLPAARESFLMFALRRFAVAGHPKRMI